MAEKLVSNDDIVIGSNEPIKPGGSTDDSGGDIILRTSGVERHRLKADGTGTGVFGGSISVLNLKSLYGIAPGQDITTALQSAYTLAAASYPNGATLLIPDPGVYFVNGASQTGTAQGYSYAGQVLIPAVALANSMPIRLKGGIRPSGGGQSTGAPNGVILLSNATSGWVFDIVPSFTEFGCPWTGVMPLFEDFVIRSAVDNPTMGALNLLCTQRCNLNGVHIDTPNSFVASGTSSLLPEALVLPQIYNNGDVTVRNSTIRGYPAAIRLSEHCVLDNVDIAYCMTSFRGGGRSHPNLFQYVDVEECPIIFDGGVAPAFGSPAPVAGSKVMGSIDIENVNTGTLKPVDFCKDTASNSVTGLLAFEGTLPGTYPITGGRSLDLMPVVQIASLGPRQRGGGWAEVHPYDNFKRVIDLSGSGAPGQCCPTLHPWRVETGSFAVTAASGLKGLTGADKCFVPVARAANLTSAQGAAPSRTITCKFTLGSAAHFRVLANAAWTGTGASNAGNTALQLNIIGGSAVTLRANNTNIVSAGANLANNSTHTVQMAVFHGSDGYPYRVKVYLDAALIIDSAIPTALKSLGLQNPASWPFYEDGLSMEDTGTAVSLFVVQELTPEPPPSTTSALTYSASITPDASQGVMQTLTVTDANAFRINAPTNPPVATATQDLTIQILNSSGGAMGAITWDAAFVFTIGAWTNPASTKKRSITFRWSGTAWIQQTPVGTDY